MSLAMVCTFRRNMNSGNAYTLSLALAIDMTARNVQDQVKKKGLPWSAAKGFDTFTPIRQVQFLFLNSRVYGLP